MTTAEPRRSSRQRWAAVVAMASAVVVGTLLVGWRLRSPTGPLSSTPPTTLLEFPTGGWGPAAATETGAATSGKVDGPRIRFDAVRTGADDSQIVVYFSGRDCGSFVGEPSLTPDLVTVRVQHIADGCTTAEECAELQASSNDGVSDDEFAWEGHVDYEYESACGENWRAVGVALPEPLRGRMVSDGSTSFPVVDSRQLAQVQFPGTDGRADRELLRTTPWDNPRYPLVYEWQQWSPPDSGIYLIQEHPAGGDLANNRCGDTPTQYTASSRVVDINGDPGELLICTGERLVVLWIHDGDQLSLQVNNKGPMDPDDFVALAQSVRFGS